MITDPFTTTEDNIISRKNPSPQTDESLADFVVISNSDLFHKILFDGSTKSPLPKDQTQPHKLIKSILKSSDRTFADKTHEELKAFCFSTECSHSRNVAFSPSATVQLFEKYTHLTNWIEIDLLNRHSYGYRKQKGKNNKSQTQKKEISKDAHPNLKQLKVDLEKHSKDFDRQLGRRQLLKKSTQLGICRKRLPGELLPVQRNVIKSYTRPQGK